MTMVTRRQLTMVTRRQLTPFMTQIFASVLLVSVLVSPAQGSIPPACLMRCKDNHLHEMKTVMGDVSEWSVDFVAPLQAILKASPFPKNERDIYKRLTHLCRTNGHYETCLNKCEDTTSREILIAGQMPSKFICNSMKQYGDVEDLIDCWNVNRGKIEHQCWQAEHSLKQMLMQVANTTNLSIRSKQFDLLCSAAQNYDSCWLTETQRYCGSRAAKFLLQLSQQTTEAMHRMLTAARFPMSGQCRQWMVMNNYTEASTDRLLAVRALIDKQESLSSDSDTPCTYNWYTLLMMVIGLLLVFKH